MRSETTERKKDRIDKKVRAGKATRTEIMWGIRNIDKTLIPKRKY